jgi:hypothetical protein
MEVQSIITLVFPQDKVTFNGILPHRLFSQEPFVRASQCLPSREDDLGQNEDIMLPAEAFRIVDREPDANYNS